MDTGYSGIDDIANKYASVLSLVNDGETGNANSAGDILHDMCHGRGDV